MALSLYIHIPFCLKRCIYCDFTSGIYTDEKAYSYIEALKKEIMNVPRGTPLSTLYIGGGTPTVLSGNTLHTLLDCIYTRFTCNDNFEATIEANPGTLDSEKLQIIRSSGTGRISIGVQSFDNDELMLLGRVHTGDEAEEAVLLARNAGFKNINIDLIYALPGQRLNSWSDTLERAVHLQPTHISAYELTAGEGTLLHKYLNSPSSPLFAKGRASDDIVIEMYNHTIEYLKSEGFIHYEISNFAQTGFQCKHNLNYWDRGEYYGAGLGAHSFICGKRTSNTDDLDEYLARIAENKSPVVKSETISDVTGLSEAIFLGLRKTDGIQIESFSQQYKHDILSCYQKEIKDLQEAGLIEIIRSPRSYETHMRLTGKGLVLSNEVFQKFI